MATRRRNKGAYMISAVAEMYQIHPQTLRLYEREGLLRPSRSEGNTRLYTDEDLERLEFILNLARDLGVNIAGIGVILQMRERMEEMNRQMQGFVDYVRTEMLSRMQQQSTTPGLVPMRRTMASLRQHGIVESEGGRGGGWSLTKPLEDITILDVQRALQGETLLDAPLSNDHPSCPVERAANASLQLAFQTAEQTLEREFARVTLADIGKAAMVRA